MRLRPSESGGVPEVAPARLETTDSLAIRTHLQEHGFACVRCAVGTAELRVAEDLLWQHLEGTEAATRRMTQVRPVGWRRNEPTTWVEGHGDALMTSTTHCASMWYVRGRPGVIQAFHAAYGTTDDAELVAAYDRMSVNLPTSSGNPGALRVAGTTSHNGKFGVAQQMHTHSGQFYGPDFHGPEYYAIVPLFDMNRKTGATALVPGSHLKVAEINRRREERWGGKSRGQDSDATKLAAAADVEVFQECGGLQPCVTSIKAGDCVLFDTRLFHGGCAAEDPSGESGNGPNQLLRAIYILGMTPTRLQTPVILQARRKAYELDLFWPPPVPHAELAGHIMAGEFDRVPAKSLFRHLLRDNEAQKRVRRFEEADPVVQQLIDPSYRPSKL